MLIVRSVLAASAILLGLILVGCGSDGPGELELVYPDCRQGGEVEALGTTWQLAEPAPNSWKDEFPVSGTVVSGLFGGGKFISGDVELDLIDTNGGGGVDDICYLWE